jgi:hypothetical protein
MRVRRALYSKYRLFLLKITHRSIFILDVDFILFEVGNNLDQNYSANLYRNIYDRTYIYVLSQIFMDTF